MIVVIPVWFTSICDSICLTLRLAGIHILVKAHTHNLRVASSFPSVGGRGGVSLVRALGKPGTTIRFSGFGPPHYKW